MIVATQIGSDAVSVQPIKQCLERGQLDAYAVDFLSDADWDGNVLAHANATPFHTSQWAQVLNKTYGHKAFGLRFVERDQTVAMLPMMEVNSPITGRRGVAMPFSDFCEPLKFESFSSKSLVQKLLELSQERGWRYFEIRGGRSQLPSNAEPAEQYYGHRLDLTGGVDELHSHLAPSVQRAIRKAKLSDLTVEITSTNDAVQDFYRLHTQTRKRHGVPPQPIAFFRHIQQEVLKKGLGFTVTAKKAGNLLAAAVFFHAGRTGLFKFGASDQNYLRLRANNIVMWQGIQQLVRLGVRSLHFGRTDIDNAGLRRFKLGWGAKEELIEYFKFNIASHTWTGCGTRSLNIANRLFRALPLAVNRFAGALIYPHLD